VFIDVIEDHPLLVYSTALPFSPLDCHLYETFHKSDTFPHIVGGFQQSWSPLLLILSGHSNSVSSVAISHDGTRVVSGSKDNTIRVWDIPLGAETFPHIREHSHDMRSVAFSEIIASGSGNKQVRIWDVVSRSADNSICIWDTWTGAQVSERLEGHSVTVPSSLDGTVGDRQRTWSRTYVFIRACWYATSTHLL